MTQDSFLNIVLFTVFSNDMNKDIDGLLIKYPICWITESKSKMISADFN